MAQPRSRISSINTTPDSDNDNNCWNNNVTKSNRRLSDSNNINNDRKNVNIVRVLKKFFYGKQKLSTAHLNDEDVDLSPTTPLNESQMNNYSQQYPLFIYPCLQYEKHAKFSGELLFQWLTISFENQNSFTENFIKEIIKQCCTCLLALGVLKLDDPNMDEDNQHMFNVQNLYSWTTHNNNEHEHIDQTSTTMEADTTVVDHQKSSLPTIYDILSRDYGFDTETNLFCSIDNVITPQTKNIDSNIILSLSNNIESKKKLKTLLYHQSHQATQTEFDNEKPLRIRNNLLLTTMNNGGIIAKKTSRSNSLPNYIYFQQQERCLHPNQKSLSTTEQLPLLVPVQQQKQEQSLVPRLQLHSLLTRGKSLDYYLSRSKRYLKRDELSVLFTMLVTPPTSATYNNDNDRPRLYALTAPQNRDSVRSNMNVLKCCSNTLPNSITTGKNSIAPISSIVRLENSENKIPEQTKSIAANKIVSHRNKKNTTIVTTTNGIKRQQSKTKSDNKKTCFVDNNDIHNVMNNLLDSIEETIKTVSSPPSSMTQDEINVHTSDIVSEVVENQNTVKTTDEKEQNDVEYVNPCKHQSICPSVPPVVTVSFIPPPPAPPPFFSSLIPPPPPFPNFSYSIPPAPPMMMGNGPPPPPPPPPPLAPFMSQNQNGSVIPPPPPFFPNSLGKPILPFKKPNRRIYDPQKDVKPLYWNKIVLNVNHSDAIWLNIEEPTFDEDSLAKMFEKPVINSSKKAPPADQHSTTLSTKSSTGKETIKLLDEKRSRAIGIFISSRHLDVQTIKDYLLKCDTSCMNIETLTGVYNNQPTDDEIQLLEPYLNDNQALDKPELFLTGLLKIPCMSDRLHCLVFEISFNETLSSIDAQLNTLLTACDELIHSTSLKQLLGLILAIGNFLNAKNNSRGCADGFGLNILPTLKDVKTKDNCSTLLNYLAEQYIKQFQMKKLNAFTNMGNDLISSSNESLTTAPLRSKSQLSPTLTKTNMPNITKFQLPVPEPSDLLTASNVNFDEIERCIENLRTKLNECQRRADLVKDELDKNFEQHDDDDRFCQHVTTFLIKARQEHSETNKQFKKAKSRFHDTCKKFCIKAITTSSTNSSSTPSTNNDEMDPKEFFKLWHGFCNDFKDAWTKEKAKLLKNRNIQSSEKKTQDTPDRTKIQTLIDKRVNNRGLTPDKFTLKKRSQS